jgi:hypothetical protein
MFTTAITVSNKISICNTQIVILYKNNLRPRCSTGTTTVLHERTNNYFENTRLLHLRAPQIGTGFLTKTDSMFTD